MRLHRRRILARRDIGRVDRHRRLGHRLVDVALLEVRGRSVVRRRPRLVAMRGEVVLALRHVIYDRQPRRRIARDLEALGEYDRDDLAEERNVLHALRRCIGRTPLRRDADEPVEIRHNVDHAGDRLHRFDVDRDDLARRNLRADQHAIRHVRELVFRSVSRRSGNLQRSVDPVERLADDALDARIQQRVRMRRVHRQTIRGA